MKLLGNGGHPEPVRYDIAEATIAMMRAEFLPLIIDGVEDKEGLVRVHDARMVVKGHRVAVEKKRKELKADALEYGRQVDAEAKRLTALMAPIEEHLQEEEDRVLAEKERIKAEREAERKAVLDQRIAALAAVGDLAPPSAVELITDEQFEDRLARSTAIFRAAEEERALERAKQEAEAAEEAKRVAAEREAEAKRVAAERAEIERQRAEQEAQQKALAEERAALERERAAMVAAQEKREAEAKAAAEAQARAKREAAEKAAWEAQRPAVERLLKFADTVEALKVPKLPDAAQLLALTIVKGAAAKLRQLAESPNAWKEESA